MPPKVATQACRWIGLLFAFIGLLGFAQNPFIGHNAAIEADMAQNIGHLVIGLYLFGISFTGESGSAFSLYMASGICLIFAVMAYSELGSYSRGFLWNAMWANRAGAYFHAAVAVLMALLGKMNTSRKQLFY
jgi:hypothetical protein